MQYLEHCTSPLAFPSYLYCRFTVALRSLHARPGRSILDTKQVCRYKVMWSKLTFYNDDIYLLRPFLCRNNIFHPLCRGLMSKRSDNSFKLVRERRSIGDDGGGRSRWSDAEPSPGPETLRADQFGSQRTEEAPGGGGQDSSADQENRCVANQSNFNRKSLLSYNTRGDP
jgi:hypothetical protein